MKSFPKGFVWGAASASYQVEGARDADGKGLSVWDMLCRKPGAIHNGHTGDIACDHYHRYREDVSLMQAIGLQAYRFSISWPRVMPSGVGPVNVKGLDFYDRLVDALLEANIQPYLTLFHWDYPFNLYLRGGWMNPDSPDWFADYTAVMVKKLSDRVGHWMTLNEPQCFISLGHYQGNHAPGDRVAFPQALQAAHHALLAHGKAVQAIRAGSVRPAQVGYAPVGVSFIPASAEPADIEAARKRTFMVKPESFWSNTWWSDPIFFGHYPEDGLALFGKNAPLVRPGDMETIAQPLDFYGVNIYQGTRVRAGADGQPEEIPYEPGWPMSLMYWPITPELLFWAPRFLFERYQRPIYIMENGISSEDWVMADGKVHDPQRIDYMFRYLTQLQKASAEGVPVAGYFHWSIMDNFEWAEGYRQRFGLIHVDYSTQQRTLKDSANYYQRLIEANAVVPPFE